MQHKAERTNKTSHRISLTEYEVAEAIMAYVTADFSGDKQPPPDASVTVNREDSGDYKATVWWDEEHG